MRCGYFGSGRLRPRVEQTFRRELLLQLLERELQRAMALRFQMLHEQLIFAARVIDIETPARDHCDAICGLNFKIAGSHAEAGALYLRRRHPSK